MQFNVAQREIVLKVVFYGPPLSGKTTNLQALHELLGRKSDALANSKLTILNTADDRTLFFDVLPVVLQTRSGYRIKLKLFTVPGQVIHAATRRLVLAGADAVVFVADSQLKEASRNNEFWRGMRRYMAENGIDPDAIPTVIQFNKRDLPNIRTDKELETIRARARDPIFTAVAIRGEGVLETLYGLIQLMFSDLNRRYQFQERFEVTTDDFLGSIFGKSYQPAQVLEKGRAE